MPPEGIPLPQPIDCDQPEADRRVEGVRLWDTRGCQKSRHTMTIRQPEQFGPGTPPYVSPGYFETISEHPMRASTRAPQGNTEACGFHFGHMIVGRDGFFQAWYGSEINNFVDSKRITPLRMHVKEQGTIGDTPTGFMYFAGMHQGKRWTEAILNSARHDCGDPV